MNAALLWSRCAANRWLNQLSIKWMLITSIYCDQYNNSNACLFVFGFVETQHFCSNPKNGGRWPLKGVKYNCPLFLRSSKLFEKASFWKKQNILNDFEKCFFCFLNRVFQLPLPPKSWYFKGSKMKRLPQEEKFFLTRKKAFFVFLFCFLTKIKSLCLLKCGASYKNWCSNKIHYLSNGFIF